MSASILQYEEAARGMMHRGAHFAQGSPVVVLDDGYWLLCRASSVAHPVDPSPHIHMLSNSSGLKPLVSFVFNPLFNVDIVMSASAMSFLWQHCECRPCEKAILPATKILRLRAVT